MPFYVLKSQPTGLYLSMHTGAWVPTLEEATVFSMKSTAQSAIRVAWRGSCVVERIERLPDRVPRDAVPFRAKRTTSRSSA